MITSFSNEKIKRVSALIRTHKERKNTGLFTAEGIKLFKEAPKGAIESVFVSESFEQQQKELLEGTQYITVSDEAFARMCDTKTPQGILTVLRQPAYTPEELIQQTGKGLIVLLEDVQDPGNVGTILRTAEGAGAAGVLLSKGCADIFSPKTIRSTMGSVFRVPFAYTDDLCGCMPLIKREGLISYAAHLDGTECFDEPSYEQGCALLIGNEGNGLSKSLSEMADCLVRIPMEGRLESLNAAVAAGIMIYTIYRKKRSIN